MPKDYFPLMITNKSMILPPFLLNTVCEVLTSDGKQAGAVWGVAHKLERKLELGLLGGRWSSACQQVSGLGCDPIMHMVVVVTWSYMSLNELKFIKLYTK